MAAYIISRRFALAETPCSRCVLPRNASTPAIIAAPSAKPSVTVSQPPAFCRIAGSSMLKTAAALITPAAKPMQGPSSF